MKLSLMSVGVEDRKQNYITISVYFAALFSMQDAYSFRYSRQKRKEVVPAVKNR